MPSASFRGRDQLLALHKLKPFTPHLSSILKTQLTFCYLPHQPFPSLLSSITCWIERIKLPFTWFSTGEKVLSLTPRIVHNSSQNSEQPFLIKKVHEYWHERHLVCWVPILILEYTPTCMSGWEQVCQTEAGTETIQSSPKWNTQLFMLLHNKYLNTGIQVKSTNAEPVQNNSVYPSTTND